MLVAPTEPEPKPSGRRAGVEILWDMEDFLARHGIEVAINDCITERLHHVEPGRMSLQS